MEVVPQIGILGMMAHATLTVQFVLGMLVLMSVVSWSMILYKFFSLSSARKRAAQDVTRFQNAHSLDEGMRYLASHPGSPVFRAGDVAIGELKRLDSFGLLKGDSMKIVMQNLQRALQQGVGSQMKEMTKSLAFLATCGNSAPFIGLFGTVWGIMHAFHSIGQLKTAALAVVAPGISEALVATAVGLAVAIPATIAYNSFLGMLSGIETELNNFSGAFLNTVQREMSGAAKDEGR